MKDLYPVYLQLYQKKVLIVGGGSIATQKIKTLLDTGCIITVVSPTITKEIASWNQQKLLRLKQREFLAIDVNNMNLIFSATNNRDVNEKIKTLANQKSIMVNAVDDPPNCDFYVPSIVRRGSLVIAISTQGECPGFAKLLRKKIEELIPSKYGEFVCFLGRLRKHMKASCKDSNQRQSVMKDVLYDGIIDDLENKTLKEVQDKVENCISTHLR
jgi:precorrin-2 dehydrogenase / sirohydrochlorin ferrochelatase